MKGKGKTSPADRERIFEDGFRSAMVQILATVRRHLGATDRDRDALLIERAQAISALRDLCDEVGDNDWDDDLHLGDIIEKHLARHLQERK